MGSDYLARYSTPQGTSPWLHYGFSGRSSVANSQHQLEAELRAKLRWEGPVASLQQQHSSRVVPLHGGSGQGADGWLLDRPRVLAIVRIADCIPLVLYHNPSKQAALLHAGRRGIAQGILAEAVHFCTARGAVAAEASLHIGPGIGSCCYQVPRQMALDFARETGHAHCYRAQNSDHSLLDLKGSLRHQALACGLKAEHIHDDAICTLCQRKMFYSHRGGDTQLRQYAFAWTQ